jgi:hypothetical protein
MDAELQKNQRIGMDEKTAHLDRREFFARLNDSYENGRGDGCSLGAFVEQNSTLSAEEFAAKFKHPFLILLRGGAEKLVDSGFFTASGGSVSAMTDQSLLKSSVFFVSKRIKKSFKNLYSIGRTDKNDISLPYSEISKFHAYIQFKNDKWSISDCDSTNGSYIEECLLDAQKPYDIRSGTRISLSKACNLIFAESLDMYFYVDAFEKLKKTKQA